MENSCLVTDEFLFWQMQRCFYSLQCVVLVVSVMMSADNCIICVSVESC